MTNTRTLPQIAKAIKALEKALDKLTLPKVLEIGKLLHEASEKCEHGEYMKWVANEFEWSHQTSLNYRNLYDFSKFPNVGNLARLNMSLTTLYLVAGLNDEGEQAARKTIIEAAKKGCVSLRMAENIYEKLVHTDDDAVSEDTVSEDADDAVFEDPTDEAPPIIPVDDDAEPSKLAALVQEMQDISANDPAWPNIMAKIGAAKLRKIIMTLKAVYAAHCETSSVKAAADRAEAKMK